MFPTFPPSPTPSKEIDILLNNLLREIRREFSYRDGVRNTDEDIFPESDKSVL